MRRLVLPDGSNIPVIGQGTWRMGERAGERAAEVAALRAGLDLGLTLIDTAEMYGDGGAEAVTGDAIAGRRDEVYLVSKVLPQNASRTGTIRACEQSLKRLKTERIDLYLLHWRGSHPLAETLAAFLDLQRQGKIGSFGVSNFDPGDMAEWLALAGAEATQTNQVLYNVTARGIEFDLLPLQVTRKIPVMSYCPLAQGDLAAMNALVPIARRHNATVAQVMLAWVIRTPHVFAVPKSRNPARLRENAAAADLNLTQQDLAEIDAIFPPPRESRPLEMV
ncbi:diketogulonate reductase-like aldo/keto reductase [Dongia mobilis]|uniref:Diketogulonate reductase-like aldo/keto reductase n=1 Tax=Dongia mobilis TaxID=578943 RepID=A0A4R6WQR9_9PROT|nr:aldo/keto reductase [Dongia mobilis]TDQ83905.1 diketogulonate reductase-like aldo/keto reductase [Dongia mobilis]